jgi:hypothetical protein
MSTRQCGCGKTLALNVRTCPECGRQFTTPTTWILGIGLPLLLIVALIYACGS